MFVEWQFLANQASQCCPSLLATVSSGRLASLGCRDMPLEFTFGRKPYWEKQAQLLIWMVLHLFTLELSSIPNSAVEFRLLVLCCVCHLLRPPTHRGNAAAPQGLPQSCSLGFCTGLAFSLPKCI